MSTAITKAKVATAAAELKSMRASLTSWLKYRSINDRIGIAPARSATEQNLANKLYALLEAIMPDARLPPPDLGANPYAAVQLAQIAITGGAQTSEPGAVGASPWMWPALIVGGLLLAVTTAIKTAADVAKDAEEKECIKAGACTDYGFWLKAGGVAALVWFAWRELGVGDVVKSHIKKRRAT